MNPSELPARILEASRKTPVKCQRKGVKRLSKVGCLKFQSRLKFDAYSSFPHSDEIEEFKQKTCQNCRHQITPEQRKALAALLKSGWEFENRQKWRVGKGYRPTHKKHEAMKACVNWLSERTPRNDE